MPNVVDIKFFTDLKPSKMTQRDLNGLTHAIIGAAIEVHRELGPGLLESIYEKCLTHLLRENNLKVVMQQKVPLKFRGLYLDCDLRFDMLVEDSVIIEIKAVDCLLPIHEAQLLTYLKLSGMQLGLLINFNVKLLKQGIRRMVL